MTSSAVRKNQVFYADLKSELQSILAVNWLSNLANTAALLFERMSDVNWVGFYLAEGGILHLGPFQGKMACTQIAFGKGVCGTVAVSGEPQIVHDVREFAGHITCDVTSRAELVVPLFSRGLFVGVLDIDSPVVGRFSQADCEGIEELVEVLMGIEHPKDQQKLGMLSESLLLHIF